MVGIKKSFGEGLASGNAKSGGKRKPVGEGMASGFATTGSFGKKAKTVLPRAKPKPFGGAVGGLKSTKTAPIVKAAAKKKNPFGAGITTDIGGHRVGKRGG